MEKYVELLESYVSASIRKDVPSEKAVSEALMNCSELSDNLKGVLRQSDSRKAIDREIKQINRFEERVVVKGALAVEFELETLKCGKQIKVYTITTPQDLTAFVGLGKYLNRGGHNVYLRGQDKFYPGMIPSLLRGKNSEEASKVCTRLHELLNIVNRSNTQLADFHDNIMEPIFQHYGMKTTMIDLVDNVWVALWFGMHTADSEQKGEYQYVHYKERQDDGYAYIFLMASDAVDECRIYGRRMDDIKYSGIYEGENTMAVDLRRALFWNFLRPHAQHGVMLSKKSKGGDLSSMDYSDLIVGVARIPVEIGKKWLGGNELLSVDTLFPSATYDHGFRMVLNSFGKLDISDYDAKTFGRIQIYN